MAKKEIEQTTQEQEWQDISNEEYRKYGVVTQMGIGEVRISEPKGLKEIKTSVGQDQYRIDHLIIDKQGEQHLIQGGWLKISFKLKS